MSLKPLNQKGFTVIEAIIIIVVLAAVGGVGYYVYHKNHKADNTHSKSKVSTTAQAKSQTDSTKYLTIKEWGVRIPLNNSILDGATYKYEDLTQTIPPTPAAQGNSDVEISAPYTADVTITCPEITPPTVKGFSRTITRYDTKAEADDVANVQDGPSAVVKAGNYYYEFGKVIEGDCQISDSDRAKMTAYRDALFDAYKEMTVLPARQQ